MVVDGKNPREHLTENDREQVVSYARLLPDIAPYAALCNGTWQVFDAVHKQQIKSLPTLRDLLRGLQRRRLTQNQRKSLVSQANRTLFAIESARDLSRLMRRCHDIIRNLKGYDPTKAFDELSKILFAKMYEEREVAEGRRDTNRFTTAAVREMRKPGCRDHTAAVERHGSVRSLPRGVLRRESRSRDRPATGGHRQDRWTVGGQEPRSDRPRREGRGVRGVPISYLPTEAGDSANTPRPARS